MINEFDEEISEEQIKEIAERILKLSDKQIDELWFRTGFVYQRPKSIYYPDKNKDFKAIFDEQIEELRKEGEKSETLWTFLSESPIKEVLKNLEDVEKTK